MIASLQGEVKEKEESSVVIEVGGIGYEVNLTTPAAARLKVGQTVRLYTVEVIREDSRELFGFLDLEARDLFRRLVAVSGVGPRTALHVLSIGSTAEVRAAIDADDVARLTSVPGVGAKTAQKIILDLRGKLAPAEKVEDIDLINALVGLGYRREMAAKALQNLAPNLGSEEERLKAALRSLGKK